MRPPESQARWSLWFAAWIFVGLICGLSEWILLRNPGFYGFLAGIAGTVVGGFISYLMTRGVTRGFNGTNCGMVGGLAGVKTGSIRWAILMGLIGGLLEGLLTRLIHHTLRAPKVERTNLRTTEFE